MKTKYKLAIERRKSILQFAKQIDENSRKQLPYFTLHDNLHNVV